MAYEFLPLPSRDYSADLNELNVQRQIEKIKEKKDNLKTQDILQTLSILASENQKLKDAVEATQLNTDLLMNKFPVQGQDQNMQRSWTGLTYAANWADYSATWACGYRRTSEGLVYLRGIAKVSAVYAYSGANSIISTLPAGFRPVTVNHALPALHYDAGYGYYTIVLVYITTNGDIQIVGGVQSPGGGGSGAANSFVWLATSFWAY